MRKLFAIGIPHPVALKPSPKKLWGVRHFAVYKLPGAPNRFARNDFAALPAIYRRWSPEWNPDPQEFDAVRASFANPASLNAAFGYYRKLSPMPSASLRARIKVPTVVFAGLDDPIVMRESGSRCYRAWPMPEMDRRTLMLMTGMGVLAAAVPIPEAQAYPRRPHAPPGSYLFHDEFDGSAGSAPDPSKWAVATAREQIKDPTFWEQPDHIGQYRNDRRNVFLDGKSNLVLRAAKDGPTYFSGKVQGLGRVGVGHTWEVRTKFDCLTAGAWPAYWLGNEDQGEIDVVEWYGNGSWPSATTVHAKANGGEWKTQNIAIDSAWHTWRCQWDEAGIRFWKDWVDGAQPYFDVPASSLPDWPFNRPGYTVFPVFNLAVAGSGGGDPGSGTYPADMLIDWIRVW